MHNVFVYGTLMVDKVADKIIGFHSDETATLLNYKRYKIYWNKTKLPYPAIIYKEKAVCAGFLFRNLSDEYLDLLDQYEGEDYDRILVKVETRTETLDAWVYIWNNPKGTELRGNWDVDEFKEKHLSNYFINEGL